MAVRPPMMASTPTPASPRTIAMARLIIMAGRRSELEFVARDVLPMPASPAQIGPRARCRGACLDADQGLVERQLFSLGGPLPERTEHRRRPGVVVLCVAP